MGLEGKQDIGVDGLLINTEGHRVLFQAKYRSNHSINHPALSTFINMSDRADTRLLISNAKLTKIAELGTARKKNFKFVDLEFLSQLNPKDFERIISFVVDQKIVEPEKKELNEMQNKVIEGIKELNTKRATCVMPCGTGKTLTSIRYAESIEAKRIIVFVPSLLLVDQCYLDWTHDFRKKNFGMIRVCSKSGKQFSSFKGLLRAAPHRAFLLQ